MIWSRVWGPQPGLSRKIEAPGWPVRGQLTLLAYQARQNIGMVPIRGMGQMSLGYPLAWLPGARPELDASQECGPRINGNPTPQTTALVLPP